MYPIEKSLLNVPFLLNDLFKHFHPKSSLRIFLCGRKPDDPRFDLRKQVQYLLDYRMGCKSFLGEDIEELRAPPKPDKNYLTIEVSEAERSDLIIMFLGSAGTIAELTAFATNKKTNQKLVIFNDIKYKDEKSFINSGPLQLIDSNSIVYYDTQDDIPSSNLIKKLDIVVSKKWFERYLKKTPFKIPLNIEEFVAYVLIYATFPIQIKGIEEFYPWNSHTLRISLKSLYKHKLIKNDEEKYLPLMSISDSNLGAQMISDISRIRTKLMNKRLAIAENITDYRLII